MTGWTPDDFAEDRGGLKDLLRKIPGFAGYLDREARRISDQTLRKWMADRLQQGKGGLDQYARGLADAARIDQLPQIDSLRSRIDTLITRLRGAPAGYSGFFDLVQVDENVLDNVYEHDLNLRDQVEQLAREMESLATSTREPSAAAGPLRQQADALDRRLRQREDLLRGAEPEP